MAGNMTTAKSYLAFGVICFLWVIALLLPEWLAELREKRLAERERQIRR